MNGSTSGHKPVKLGPGPAYRPLGEGEYAATYRFLRRTSVEIFAASPQAEKPWANDAIAYLEEFAFSASHAMGPTDNGLTYLERGRALLAAGCDDALVLYIAANTDVALKRKALDHFVAGSPYPPFRTFLSAKAYLPYLANTTKDSKADDERYAKGILIESARQMMHEKTDDPIYRQFIARLLNDGITNTPITSPELREALTKDVSTGSVEPWLTQMVQGYLEVYEAWKVRGGGWASTVNQKGWDGLHAHLLNAQEHFEKAWRTEPSLACSAIEMINVVMGQGGSISERIDWFNHATAVSPECADAYSYIFNALSPSWGGSSADILAIGLRALETKDFTGEVPNYYLKALSIAGNEGRITAGKNPDLYADPEVWNNIRTLMEGYLAAPAYAGLRTWNLQRYAGFAYRCHQRQTFARLITELGGIDKLGQALHQDAVPEARRWLAGQ